MNQNTFPTKGNYILAKNSLVLAKQGYELMDKKRNILIHELLELISSSKSVEQELNDTFKEAYEALMRANIEMGIHHVEEVSNMIPVEESVSIKMRSIMGTEIPLVSYEETKQNVPGYAFVDTRLSLDEATHKFNQVKKLTLRLAEIDNSAYRLAVNIKKTQMRANALKNITIPYYQALTKSIAEALEQKDLEEFTRLKVVKRMVESKK
ncbi:MAG: V-type ATP synthase subunit D [Lachnospiraceae bacterium]|nr:V-type ATP synthase subunit D [Lachnospiraceae bacterium]